MYVNVGKMRAPPIIPPLEKIPVQIPEGFSRAHFINLAALYEALPRVRKLAVIVPRNLFCLSYKLIPYLPHSLTAGLSAGHAAEEEGEGHGHHSGAHPEGVAREGKGCSGPSRCRTGLEPGRSHSNERGQPHGLFPPGPEDVLQLQRVCLSL